ncbi:MAG: hypothetical protein AAFY03_06985 [Pseudomonadota bacterium]
MKKLTAIAFAAAVALTAAPAVSQDTLAMGQSMLTGALFNALRAEGFSADGIDKLTLGEVAQLRGILNGDASRNEKAGQVSLILERAQSR